MPGKPFAPPRQSFPTDIVAAECLEGGRVVDSQGTDVGLVLDVLLDLERGAIAYAIVAQAERVIAVPWDQLLADGARLEAKG